MNAIALTITLGLFATIAGIALLGRWAADNIDEANGLKHPADEANERNPLE